MIFVLVALKDKIRFNSSGGLRCLPIQIRPMIDRCGLLKLDHIRQDDNRTRQTVLSKVKYFVSALSLRLPALQKIMQDQNYKKRFQVGQYMNNNLGLLS